MTAERKTRGDWCAESTAITEEYLARFIAFDMHLL
jgi:hypothetical protein